MDGIDPQWDRSPHMQRFRAYDPKSDRSESGPLAAFNLSSGLAGREVRWR
jgi:branched-chain amino acid transport system substrate-binding protein